MFLGALDGLFGTNFTGAYGRRSPREKCPLDQVIGLRCLGGSGNAQAFLIRPDRSDIFLGTANDQCIG